MTKVLYSHYIFSNTGFNAKIVLNLVKDLSSISWQKNYFKKKVSFCLQSSCFLFCVKLCRTRNGRMFTDEGLGRIWREAVFSHFKLKLLNVICLYGLIVISEDLNKDSQVPQ
jgi:hypothetical protein